jgi:hypothetical protein
MAVIAFQGHHVAAGVVIMVMMMVIYGQGAHYLFAEQLDIAGIVGHGFRVPGTTDMMIEADNLVRVSHDQMQIMGYHQHATPPAVADAGNEPVEIRLPGHVDALGGFIQDQ